MSDTDTELLARYTDQRAEDAFAEIVRRHLGLVYSAALRQVRSMQLAEEVAQSAFIDLSRQADRLKPDTILTAWLYQVTRRTVIDVVRREARRSSREQVALEMNATNATTADWAHIEPLLDEAMLALDDSVRSRVPTWRLSTWTSRVPRLLPPERRERLSTPSVQITLFPDGRTTGRKPARVRQ